MTVVGIELSQTLVWTAKKPNRLVTVKLQKKKIQTDFAHFPCPGDNDPYAKLSKYAAYTKLAKFANNICKYKKYAKRKMQLDKKPKLPNCQNMQNFAI